MEERLLLRRYSEGYNPLFLGELDLANIHFFDANGIKFSTGHGWFSVIRNQGPTEGEYRWCHTQSDPDIDFGVACVRKLKADFASKQPFYIRVPRESWQDKDRKRAELYLPFGMFEWTVTKEFSVSQYEDRQILDDLYGIESLGIGVEVRAGEKMVNREQATEEKTRALLEEMEPEMAQIIDRFTKRLWDYRKTKRQLEAQLEETKRLLDSLDHPSWIDDIVKPIGEAMLKFPELADREIDILGPFGIGARTSIHFYRKGVPESERFHGGNCLSITFEPGDLDSGELYIVDEGVDTKEFRPGTIGELNGMNHPLTPMPKSMIALVKRATH